MLPLSHPVPHRQTVWQAADTAVWGGGGDLVFFYSNQTLSFLSYISTESSRKKTVTHHVSFCYIRLVSLSVYFLKKRGRIWTVVCWLLSVSFWFSQGRHSIVLSKKDAEIRGRGSPAATWCCWTDFSLQLSHWTATSISQRSVRAY